MEKLLERMEGLARFLVPLAYMVGLIGGTTYYFTDGAGNFSRFLLDIGGALAIATELHSFLLQRRVLVTWTQRRKADNPADEDAAWRDLKMYGGWLAALLAFQVFTSVMYRSALYHPAGVWSWLQTGISGAVIPVFFFGVAFLANVVIDPVDVQEETKRNTAMQSARAGQWVAQRALKAATRSFNWRLRQAEKDHADLTGLAVSMQRRFGDDEGAQTLMVIDNELRQVEGLESRRYATQWHNPDAPKTAVVPAPAPAAEGVMAFPDLARLSDDELRAYMQQLITLGRQAHQGERHLDSDAYLAEHHRVLAELAGRGVPVPPLPEPGRVRRPEGDELDKLVESLGGGVSDV